MTANILSTSSFLRVKKSKMFQENNECSSRDEESGSLGKCQGRGTHGPVLRRPRRLMGLGGNSW